MTAITADCPRWSPKFINTTCIPIKTMATCWPPVWRTAIPHHTGTSSEKMRIWLTARPVTTGALRSMHAESLEGLKVQMHQQKQKTKKLEAIKRKEEAKLFAKAASLNLSTQQYVIKKRKAEGISSPKKSPKKAKRKDFDDAAQSPRAHTVTLPAQLLTRSRGVPGHGTLRRTRTRKQAGKALRSQGHPHARAI